MSKLYELTGEFNGLYNLIDDMPEGEFDEQAIVDTLEGIQGEIQDKAVNIALLIKDLNAEADALKAEEDRIKKRRQQKQNAVERITDYLSYNLQAVGLEKVDTPQAVIKFRKTKATEVVDPESVIKFCEGNGYDRALKYSVDVSKTELKKLIESGVSIPGAQVIEKKNISIG